MATEAEKPGKTRLQYPIKLSNKVDIEKDANSDTRFLIIEPYVKKAGDVKVKGLKVGETLEAKASPVSFQGKKFYLVLPAKPVTIDLAHDWNMGDFIPEIGEVEKGGNLGKIVIDTATRGLKRKGTKFLLEKANELTGGGVNTLLQHAGKGQFQPRRMFYGGTQPFGFSFSWKMSPRNKEEAKVIRQIVDVFKYYTTAQDPSDKESNDLLVTQPPYWKITYVNGEALTNVPSPGPDIVSNLFFNKNEMDDLVCTNVSVDYSEGEIYTTFPDNFPTVINLKVQFKMAQNIKSAEKLFGQMNSDFMAGDR